MLSLSNKGSSFRFLSFLVAFVVAFAISASAYATDYYMSPQGNDSNDGRSVNTPWRTMTKLHNMQDSLKSGDIVYFRGGDYVTGDNDRAYYSFRAAGTTYKNYQNEKPVLVLDRIVNKPDVRIFIYLGAYVTVDGLTLRQTERSRSRTLLDDGTYLYQDRGVGASAFSTWATDSKVKNCSITNFTVGVFSHGKNTLVENCTITGSISHGFYIAGENGTYRYNTLDGSRGFDDEYNVQLQWDTSIGNKIYGNLMLNGQAGAVTFSGQVSNNEVFNNIIINGGKNRWKNFGYPLNFYCWHGAVRSGNKFYNNTIIGSGRNDLILPGTPSNCEKFSNEPLGRNVAIYNNIFYPSTPTRVGLSTPNVHNNIFYNVSGSVPSGNTLINPMLANPFGTRWEDAKILNGSPAVDKAPSGAPSFDFSNGDRPVGAYADIGAFELGAIPNREPPPIVNTPNNPPAPPPFTPPVGLPPVGIPPVGSPPGDNPYGGVDPECPLMNR